MIFEIATLTIAAESLLVATWSALHKPTSYLTIKGEIEKIKKRAERRSKVRENKKYRQIKLLAKFLDDGEVLLASLKNKIKWRLFILVPIILTIATYITTDQNGKIFEKLSAFEWPDIILFGLIFIISAVSNMESLLLDKNEKKFLKYMALLYNTFYEKLTKEAIISFNNACDEAFSKEIEEFETEIEDNENSIIDSILGDLFKGIKQESNLEESNIHKHSEDITEN